jgi:two-component system, chemotaxis family, protein-glutamate methylesterase/glutaminase
VSSATQPAGRSRDVVVVGASAGGVQALTTLAAGLPGDFPGALMVVLHLPAAAPSALPRILSRAGPLAAAHPSDGEPIMQRRIYVAPPDHHMVLRDGVVRVVRGPRENGHRPAVDPLFRSAARHWDGRVAAVVLSGALDDGAAGLAAVKRRGGVAVVQDPADALYPGMPLSALAAAPADHVAPAGEIAGILLDLASGGGQPPAPGVGRDHPLLDYETGVAEMTMRSLGGYIPPGLPSGFTCPDCGGSLWQMPDESLVRYRCRVGHAWAPDSLLAQQDIRLETALWAALRALEERADLSRRLADRAREHGHASSAAQFDEQWREALDRADSLRAALGLAAKEAESEPTAEAQPR